MTDRWITIEAERALYLQRGQEAILCDGGHPGPVVLVLKVKEQAMTYSYPHMCRDEHIQIGHNDSEHERCPLCRALDRAVSAERAMQEMMEVARQADAEIERLRAALIRFADRSNWYFEGDHMCPEWMGKDLPWDYARSLCEQSERRE
jgi:hypothetical protein